METVRVTDLPVEVISHILKFLPYPDLQDARLVCRKFYDASLGENFYDLEWIVFNERRYSVLPEDLMHCQRDFLHCKFELHRSFSYNTIWSCLGPKLKSLSLVQCSITEDQLFKVLSQCARLRCLEISACWVAISSSSAAQPSDNYDLTFKNESHLPLNLESLSIIDQLDPRMFWKILKCSPNLKSLSVEGFWDPEEALFRQEFSDIPSLVPLTTDHIFAYIRARGQNLLDLRLIIDTSDSQLRNDAEIYLSNALSEANNLRLRKLETNVELTENFLLNQKDCQELKLENVTDERIGFISRELQNLKRLDAHTVISSTSDVENFSSLENLTSLRFDFYPRKLDYDRFSGLCLGKEVNTTLKDLELIDTWMSVLVSPGCVSQIARTHPALTHLNLKKCLAVDNISVQSIFEHLVSLESLKLSECHNLSDAGLKGFLRASFSVDKTDNQTIYGFARLKKLRTLDLSGCGKITGEAFTNELKFPELRYICLDKTRISCSVLIPFIENNRTIERLYLGGCIEFTDEFVSVVLKNLWRLRRIRTGISSGISAENVQLLKKQCKRVYNLHATVSSCSPKPNPLVGLLKRLCFG